MRLLVTSLAALMLLASNARAEDDFEAVPLGAPPPAPKKAPPKPAKPSKPSASEDDDLGPMPLVPNKAAPAQPPQKAKPAPTPTPTPMPPPTPEVSRKKAAPSRVVAAGPTAPLAAGEKVLVTVRVYDVTDQLITADLKVSADVGIYTTPVEARGVYTFWYTAPALPPQGSVTVTVTATAPGAPMPVSAQFAVSFAPGASTPLARGETPSARPAKLVIDGPSELRAGETAQVRYHVEDANGERLPGDGVRLKSAGGTVSNVREENGEYVADVVADARGELRLSGESGGQRLDGGSTILVQSSSPGDDRQRLGLGLSAFAGGFTNFGKLASPQFELAAEYAVTDRIHLGVLGGFAPASVNVPAANGRNTAVSMSLIPVLARATFVKELSSLMLYGGGMAGLELVSGTVQGSGPSHPFKSNVLDLVAFGGAGLPVGPGAIVGELRLARAPLAYEDANASVKGSLGGLSLAVGYQLQL